MIEEQEEGGEEEEENKKKSELWPVKTASVLHVRCN